MPGKKSNPTSSRRYRLFIVLLIGAAVVFWFGHPRVFSWALRKGLVVLSERIGVSSRKDRDVPRQAVCDRKCKAPRHEGGRLKNIDGRCQNRVELEWRRRIVFKIRTRHPERDREQARGNLGYPGIGKTAGETARNPSSGRCRRRGFFAMDPADSRYLALVGGNSGKQPSVGYSGHECSLQRE